MKKVFVFISIFFFITACGTSQSVESPHNNYEDYQFIEAIVIDMLDQQTSAFVVDVKNQLGYVVYFTEEEYDEIAIGVELAIYYDAVMESDPMQIDPKGIKILEKETNNTFISQKVAFNIARGMLQEDYGDRNFIEEHQTLSSYEGRLAWIYAFSLLDYPGELIVTYYIDLETGEVLYKDSNEIY